MRLMNVIYYCCFLKKYPPVFWALLNFIRFCLTKELKLRFVVEILLPISSAILVELNPEYV